MGSIMEFCVTLEDGELSFAIVEGGISTSYGKGWKAKADALDHFSRGRQRTFEYTRKIISDQIEKADAQLRTGLRGGKLHVSFETAVNMSLMTDDGRVVYAGPSLPDALVNLPALQSPPDVPVAPKR
jgi:hypothetical protein